MWLNYHKIQNINLPIFFISISHASNLNLKKIYIKQIYKIKMKIKSYLSLFLPPKSLLILSNTVLRGSCIFGLFPFSESCDMTWIIIQSTIFLSRNFLIQSVMLSFTVLLNSSASFWEINHSFSNSIEQNYLITWNFHDY